MLPQKLRKRQILPFNQNLSSVYFSLAKFQLVSCNLPLAMTWQMTYTHKLPKLCSATLIGAYLPQQYGSPNEINFRSLIIIVQEAKKQNLSLQPLSLCRELGKGCAHFPVHHGYRHYLVRPNCVRRVLPVLPILANSCFLFASCNRL